MVAQHVHHTYLWDGDAKQFWPLGHTGTNEQAAVRAADDGQLVLTRIALADQPLGSTDEVVEHVLLLHLRTSQVPLLTILTATSQRHLCIDAAILEEGDACSRETRTEGDVESTVAIEIDRILAVLLQPFLIGEEHGYACAVLALEEDLLRGVVVLTELHLGR